MVNSLEFTLPFRDNPLSLRLFGDGALFWPEGKTLFVTDPHFGKADSFRYAGIAIPDGILDRDLARITNLLSITKATTFVILGDFFHTRHSQSENVLASLSKWRAHHADLRIDLVLGNHDAHAGVPPFEIGIHAVEAPYPLGPFICCHLPQPVPHQDGYILAGHLHPAVTIRDRDGSTLRLAAFIFGPDQAILPAFGGFTGGSAYRPRRDDYVFVIAQDEIVAIPRPGTACVESPPHRQKS